MFKTALNSTLLPTMLTNAAVITYLRALAARQAAAAAIAPTDWQAEHLRKLSRQHDAMAAQMARRPDLFPLTAAANRG